MSYYDNDFIDFVMGQKKFLPRYARLSRKALHYYLGDQYNPHAFSWENEYFIRQMIAGWIELNVFERIPYDWPVIDHFLRKVIHDFGYPHITYDMRIIEQGYHGIMRGDLPQYCC